MQNIKIWPISLKFFCSKYLKRLINNRLARNRTSVLTGKQSGGFNPILKNEKGKVNAVWLLMFAKAMAAGKLHYEQRAQAGLRVCSNFN
ncbi:MAG: hypothetical protein KDD19_22020, partial [Phaeodactylibacter sp.]|nr:hypothetical protein [Phaeodactylibacter sp.]